jgi:hypothetical protein
MRVTHYAKRSVVTAALALALAACGKDSSAPSEFNPQGTSADMTATESAFSTEQMSSFAVLGADISAKLNGTALVMNSALAVRGATGGAARYARELTALVPRSGAFPASLALIPSQYLGTTFVWNVDSSAYVASDLAGAPSAGVRFLLYAVDPVLFQPVVPLVEVGYVDVTDHSTASTVDVNVKVVEGSVVYLEYDVTGHATATGGVITISGFASNGTTLANFDLNNTISDNNGSPVIAFDYHIDVPSRHLSLNWTATVSYISATETAVTLNFSINGPNGSVQVLGSYTASGGTLTVKVNGAVFATANLDGVDPVITGADGQPLTADEEATMRTIVEFYLNSPDVFAGLLAPVA